METEVEYEEDQKGTITIGSVVDFNNLMKKQVKPTQYQTAEENLRDVTIEYDLVEEERIFSNGLGNSIQSITLKVDLSKTAHPWQPHTSMGAEVAEKFAEFMLKEYSEYLEFQHENREIGDDEDLLSDEDQLGDA